VVELEGKGKLEHVVQEVQMVVLAHLATLDPLVQLVTLEQLDP